MKILFEYLTVFEFIFFFSQIQYVNELTNCKFMWIDAMIWQRALRRTIRQMAICYFAVRIPSSHGEYIQFKCQCVRLHLKCIRSQRMPLVGIPSAAIPFHFDIFKYKHTQKYKEPYIFHLSLEYSSCVLLQNKQLFIITVAMIIF